MSLSSQDFKELSRILSCFENIRQSPFALKGSDLFKSGGRGSLTKLKKHIPSISDLAESPITAKHFWQWFSQRDLYNVADAAFFYFCRNLYPGTHVVGEGELSWPKSQETTKVLPNVKDTAIVPLSNFQNDWVENLVNWTTLYNQTTVFVLPYNLSSLDISYSGRAGERSSWSEVEVLLACNKYYQSFVAEGKCIFLPNSNSHTVTSTWDHGIDSYNAPLVQSPEELIYTPVNKILSSSADLNCDSYQGFIFYHNILLPYFRGVRFEDIIRIAKNESDSFVKFNYYLSKKLRGLSDSSEILNIKEITNEIDYEISNLNIEFKKLKKLKILQKAQVAFFSISLGALAFTDIEIVKQIAGISGSINLFNLLKDYIGYKREAVSLQKSDFYLPFLINQEHK